MIVGVICRCYDLVSIVFLLMCVVARWRRCCVVVACWCRLFALLLLVVGVV